MNRAALLLLFIAFFTSMFASKGIVFVDLNANGLLDNKETGLADCLVSDGKTIVKTDANGAFELNTDQPFIFLILPDGYNARQWFVNSGEENVFFPLTECEQKECVFAVVNDIHYAKDADDFAEALKDRHMEYDADLYMDLLTTSLVKLQPSFVVALGDIGASIRDIDDEVGLDQLRIVRKYMESTGLDIYYAVGNHEVDKHDANPTWVYEVVFGPRYYSFNRDGVHFVVLDTHFVADGKFHYGIDTTQLQWLKMDLEYTRRDCPIVVFSHEPFYDLEDCENTRELADLLVNYNITAHISGHWHQMAVLNKYPYLEITCGAVCGGWWEGPSPTGDQFGYSLFILNRGSLCFGYFNLAEEPSIWFEFPLDGTLSDIVPLRVVTSEPIAKPKLSVDETELSVEPFIIRRKHWIEYLYHLNVSNLADGEHTVSFGNELIRKDKKIWVQNQSVRIEQIKDFCDSFEGRTVTITGAIPKAIWRSNVSFDDGSDIIMANLKGISPMCKIEPSTYYTITGIVRNVWNVADPLRIYLDEGIVQK